MDEIPEEKSTLQEWLEFEYALRNFIQVCWEPFERPIENLLIRLTKILERWTPTTKERKNVD